MSDVEQVMSVMGKPEEFGEGQNRAENKNEEEQFSYSEEKIKRRLFRNPDEKAIGGVCSGLAAYFDIDTVWVRLAMFLLIFFGGLSLWVYIILWIIIPQAKTTADKFAMRGEAANINTIFKSFKDEAEDVKNRFAKQSKRQYREVHDTVRENLSHARSNGAHVLNTLFNIMGRLIGLFLIIIGAMLLFTYVAALLGISVSDSNNDVSHWKSVIFGSSSDYALAILAFIIVLGIPIFMLLYGGIKLLFKIRYSNRWLNLSMGIIWAIGLFIGLYITVVTIKEFGENSRLKETFVLHGVGDTLRIKLNPATVQLKSMNYENADDLENYITNHHGDNYTFGEANKGLSIIGNPEINVVEGNSDSVELVISRESRGNGKKEANENAKSIKYSYQQVNNELIFDEIFVVAMGAKFRAQEVNIKIKVPKGKVVYFDKSIKYLLEDIDNTSNTWTGDMVSRRWIMTEKGLKCIDCNDLETHDDKDDFNKEKVTINEDGIEVNGKEAEIKIDENGIKIKTPEKEMEFKTDKHKSKKKEKEKKNNE